VNEHVCEIVIKLYGLLLLQLLHLLHLLLLVHCHVRHLVVHRCWLLLMLLS
jgi:hypothetical protein